MRILICALALSLLPISAFAQSVEVTPGPGVFREKGDRGRDFDRSREDRSRKEFGRDDESHGGGNCKTVIVREGGTTKKIKRCGN
jgi:hypothetical protein